MAGRIKNLMLFHEYFGEKTYKNRRSFVFYDEIQENWVVIMLSDESSHIVVPKGHSEQYAEDCAENWTNGVIKEANEQTN